MAAASLLDSYLANKILYDQCTTKVEALIRELLAHEKIGIHQITSRVKSIGKVEEKIKRKDFKYDSIDEITDVCGIRIITYFEDEVDKIAEIIQREFKIDTENSIDKRRLETDKFGYRSLHYVAAIDTPRKGLPEYKSYAGIKFEIQIRTILQHSWAEIEHDLGYKSENAIPNSARRTFNRIAAILEIADSEFVKLKELLSSYEFKVETELNKNPENFDIDQTSLSYFILNNPVIARSDQYLSEKSKLPLGSNYYDIVDILISKIQKKGILTIKQLTEFIEKNEDLLVKTALKIHEDDVSDQGSNAAAWGPAIILFLIDQI